MKARHIGIVACSAEGAALCYREICHFAQQRMGEDMHPQVTLHSHPLGTYMEAIRADRWGDVAKLMLDSTERLAAAGAELVVCPDNTIHQVYDEVAELGDLPWLHIADVVAARAARDGHRRVAVLGTRYLMEGPVYEEAMRRVSIAIHVPNASEREEIDRTIFDELVKGRFEDRARDRFAAIVERAARAECDAVVLGCTEIPLLIGDADVSLPTLDSTRLLAAAAVRAALAS